MQHTEVELQATGFSIFVPISNLHAHISQTKGRIGTSGTDHAWASSKKKFSKKEPSTPTFTGEKGKYCFILFPDLRRSTASRKSMYEEGAFSLEQHLPISVLQ